MKKLLVIFLAVFFTIPVFSQIKFGLKAGVSTSSLSMEKLKTITDGQKSYTVNALTEAKYGFHGGAFVRLSLFGIYLQPELLFSSRSNDYRVTDVTNVQDATETIVKQNFNKLDIPVMLGFKLGPLRLNAGPAASILINSPKDLIDDPDFKSMYSNMTIGYQAGIGVDVLKKLTLDLRYEGSLKKYQNQIESLTGTTFNLDDRANAFLLSIGLIF